MGFKGPNFDQEKLLKLLKFFNWLESHKFQKLSQYF